jgi:hypothetical protein
VPGCSVASIDTPPRDSGITGDYVIDVTDS